MTSGGVVEKCFETGWPGGWVAARVMQKNTVEVNKTVPSTNIFPPSM